MDRASKHSANRYPRPQATSVASEWGKTFLAQSVVGILLAFLWVMLGLQ